MTEIDPQTAKWIHSLKLNKNFKTISDFENGYSFGLIFQKLQLSKGKKFKNSSDMACIFHNYKNVKDLLLENFHYDFPINNIIYRTQDLLQVVRDETMKHQQRKKQATMKAVTTIRPSGQTMIQPQQQKNFKNREKQITGTKANFLNNTTKLPKKIQDIEKKLDRFRDEKTKHQLFALDDRKYEIENNRRAIQDHREYQISKIRRMHENGKDQQKKVYDIWSKTEQIKHSRMAKDKAFSNFMQEKKDKFSYSLKQQQQKIIKDGQQAFQLNCIRHGIQLDHDPDKPLKPDGEFNKVVVMQRIKDNIKKHEQQKKQIKKRQNKKRVDGNEAKIRSEEVWKQNSKLQDYQKKLSSHFGKCQEFHHLQEQKFAQKETIKLKISKKTYVDLPAIGNQQSRAQQYRQRKLQYMKNDVQFLQKKYNKLHSMAEEVVQALLHATIEGQQKFQQKNSFSYFEWKEVEKIFMDFKGDKKSKGKQVDYYGDHSNFNHNLIEYIQEKGNWRNFHYEKEFSNEGNIAFAETINSLISISYPDKVLPQSQEIPLHMPLKVMFSGDRVAGKTTHTGKIAQKFGLNIIDPVEILKQAIELAKPPSEQDPKKGKKDAKKPEEMTPQRLALKEFGSTLLQKGIQSHENASNQTLIEVIKYRMKELFKIKKGEQVIKQYEQAKVKEEERHAQALKQFEEGAKKPKKDSKKGGNQVPDQPPKPKQLFYSSGYVIDNYPLSFSALKLLEQQLNSYIPEDQRVNQQAEQIRSKFSLVIPIPQKQVDTTLKNGVFDYVFELTAAQQNREKRKTGRKIDPSTKIVYHPDYNPIPTDIKGFAEKLLEVPVIEGEQEREIEKVKEFYKVFGNESQKLQTYQQVSTNETLQQSSENILECVKKILFSKYSQLQKKKAVIEEAKQKAKMSEQPEKQQAKQNVENAQQQKEESKQNKQEEEKKEQQKQGQEEKKQVVNEQAQQNKQEQFKQFEKSLEQQIQSLSKENCSSLLERYNSALTNYTQGIKESMSFFEIQRSQFENNFLSVQKEFTNLINRPDDKAGKILGFQENYNKLLNEQESIVRDVDASKHLVKKLSQLYDSLWNSLCEKKNEAVEERQRFIQSNWLDNEGKRVIEIAKKLLQDELNLLCQSIFFILSLSCQIQNKSSNYVTEYLSLGIAPALEPINSIDRYQVQKYDRLQFFLDQVDQCIETLPAWIDQKRKKMKIQAIPSILSLIDKFVSYYLDNLQKKKALIYNKIRQRLLQERSYYDALINKMDEWIIQGIKFENDFVYDIYKSMKKSIQDAKRSNVKDLFVKQITDVFTTIKQLTLKPMPMRLKTHHRQLPIYSYMIFLLEIKSLANSSGKINFEILKKYLAKRKKSNLLDKRILSVDFDTISQFLVKDNFLEFKELATAMVLWNINVFDDDALAKYKFNLLQEPMEEQKQAKQVSVNLEKQSNHDEQIEENKEKSENQQQKKEENDEENEKQMKKQESKLLIKNESVQRSIMLQKKHSFLRSSPVHKRIYFDDLIMMDGAFDEEESYIIKHFIFQIFRQESTDYIDAQIYLDTLSLFDQIQVLKYGDTIMMLDP